jgi:hypothetical protein
MVMSLPPDFSEFLKLLNCHHVDYLLVGGFAVGFHGYPRATSDMDIWVSQSPETQVASLLQSGRLGLTPRISPKICFCSGGESCEWVILRFASK